jgi:hypothetical protein
MILQVYVAADGGAHRRLHDQLTDSSRAGAAAEPGLDEIVSCCPNRHHHPFRGVARPLRDSSLFELAQITTQFMYWCLYSTVQHFIFHYSPLHCSTLIVSQALSRRIDCDVIVFVGCADLRELDWLREET